MATMKDVALHAGVSTATVSHVLNGTRAVAESTRQRVLDSMKTLGYTPSAFGRGLRRQSWRTLGLVVGDIANPYFGQVFRGMESVALRAGYTVIVSHSNEDEAKEEEALGVLMAKGVDGIVVAPSGSSRVLRETIDKKRLPIVLIDRTLAGLQVASVTVDVPSVLKDVVRRLVGLGHRKIGIISGYSELSTTHERLEAYREGLGNLQEFVFAGDSQLSGGKEAAHWYVEQHPDLTAVIGANNLMAMGFVRELQVIGRYPPSAVVLGVDDEPWTEMVSPPLSVIRQPTVLIGQTAAELLMRKIQGTAHPVDSVILSAEWIERTPLYRPGQYTEGGRSNESNTASS